MKKQLVLIVFILLLTVNSLLSQVYGSIYGKVRAEDTLLGVPEVQIYLYGPTIKLLKTDENGDFRYSLLKPGKYSVIFSSKFPYCSIGESKNIYIEPGKIVKIEKILKIGGLISGKVFHNDGVTPFPNVYIKVFGVNAGSSYCYTNDQGNFELGKNGGICPSEYYYLTAKCNIPGIAYKIIPKFNVEKGKRAFLNAIKFNLNDTTGIDGYITSNLDSKPLKNVSVYILNLNILDPAKGEPLLYGEVISNEEGYFSIKNLDPGMYELYALPELQERISLEEYELKAKSITNIHVKSGIVKRINFKMEISQTSN